MTNPNDYIQPECRIITVKPSVICNSPADYTVTEQEVTWNS